MAVCRDCNQEMRTAATCTVDVLIMRGERFERDRVGQPLGPNGRCGDCGVQRGGFHHFGCDLEECPRCRWQLLSCGCPLVDGETEALMTVAEGVVVYPDELHGLPVPPTRFPFGGGTPGPTGT